MSSINTVTKNFNPGLTHPNYLMRKKLVEAIISISPMVKGKVMDLGCGSKPYRSLFECDEYIGVDFENPGHPHLNEQVDVFYDGKTLPFENNFFDVIFSSEVFEHVFNLHELLVELKRVLRPGGKLIFTCPFAFPEHEQPNDFARYTSFAVADLMKTNGFSIHTYIKSGNSIEALGQLKMIYAHLHIVSLFKNIPIIRQGVRLFTYTTINLWTIFWSKILPKSDDLYMNNIVVATKN
ncbi:MAG: methyltransferase domain-containing protein [Bacteroidota bacterium]